MKKIFILIVFLLLTTNVQASSIYDFKFTKENIYDYANIFSDIEFDQINNSIKEFELKSSIDLSLITVDSLEEAKSISNTLSDMKVNNDESIYIPSIVIIYEKNGEMDIMTNSVYNDVWGNDALKKFKSTKLSKYDNIFIYISEIDLMINDWIEYYDYENIINVVFILTIAALITMVIVRLLTKNYRPKFITEADKYINEDKIIVK